MINTPVCRFSDVSEHDMDMLFLEEFVCSRRFLEIFTSMIGIGDAKVAYVHASKTDAALGESDMTVVIESAGERIGLLIEDKIDAIAMPQQSARYDLRGQKGVDSGDYSQFFVFIVAPQKYLLLNAEAQKYPNKVEYETILSYFEELDDPRSPFKIQQIKQAIEKQKKGYQVEIDEAVTEFWSKYSEYQKEHYPNIKFRYNGEIKGSFATWPRFQTVYDGLYMNHKTEMGFVDMTFEGCADKILDVEGLLSDAVGDYLKEGFSVHKTGKSTAIRLIVPVLDLHKPFDSEVEKVERGLAAVNKMSELAKLLDFRGVVSLLTK